MLTALRSPFGKFLYIFLGFIVGALVVSVFSFFVARNNEKKESQNPAGLNLVLTEPTESLSTNTKTLTISGSTQAGSIVTINSPQKNFVLESNDGKFSAKIDLLEGKNTLNITAFDKTTGESQTLSRDILFLDEELTNL